MSFKKRIKRVLKGDTHRAGGFRIINGKPVSYAVINGRRTYAGERGKS